MIRALVITHGRIGEELVRVSGMILGPHEGLDAMSNAHRSAQDITEAVREWLGSGPESGPAVILVDDYGGSCATASQLACEGRKDTAVISGVNLAMILGFLTWRDSGDFADLVSRLVAKGREAIVRLGAR
jgi:mannose/fructose-specific phosphotransferase system component IIA